MKEMKRTWKVTLTVVNDIRHIHGSLTRLIPGARIKEIIRDEIDNRRDLKAQNIEVREMHGGSTGCLGGRSTEPSR